MLFIAMSYLFEQNEPSRPDGALVRAKDEADLRTQALAIFRETFYEDSPDAELPEFQKSDTGDYGDYEIVDDDGQALFLTRVRLPKRAV